MFGVLGAARVEEYRLVRETTAPGARWKTYEPTGERRIFIVPPTGPRISLIPLDDVKRP